MVNAGQAVNASYACSAVTIVILVLRLLSARGQPRDRRFELTFFVVAFAAVIVLARVILSKYALEYGTINDYNRSGVELDEDIIARVRKGTYLTLTIRVLLTVILWSQCFTLLLLFQRIADPTTWMKRSIFATYLFMAATLLAVIFATFFECHPLSLFWRVSPPPGQCVKALVQVSLQCVGNIVTDLLLIAMAIAIISSQVGSGRQRAKLIVLFSLGIFCCIINCLRLYYTFQSSSSQPERTFWASIAIVTSAFVANAPAIYGAWRLRSERIRSRKSDRAGLSRNEDRPEAEHEQEKTRKITITDARVDDRPQTHQ